MCADKKDTHVYYCCFKGYLLTTDLQVTPAARYVKMPLTLCCLIELQLRDFISLKEVGLEKNQNYISLFPSWSSRPNPEDRINRKPDDWKNDRKSKKTQDQKYCVQPNIRSNLHLVISAYHILSQKLIESSVSSPSTPWASSRKQ